MAIRRDHDRARPQLPRSKDLRTARPRPANGGHPGRDTSGKFVAGNKLARGRAWREKLALLALSDDNRALARAFELALPASSPAVRAACVSQARAFRLAAILEAKAIQTGLETPDGRGLLEQSHKQSMLALRAGIVAYDLSVRLCEQREDGDGQPAWLRTIEAHMPATVVQVAEDGGPRGAESENTSGAPGGGSGAPSNIPAAKQEKVE